MFLCVVSCFLFQLDGPAARPVVNFQYTRSLHFPSSQHATTRFRVQGSCVKMLAGQGKIREAKSVKAIVALLSEPLAQYGDVVTVLQLGHYGQLMATLEFETNKVMAVLVIQSILKNGTRIGDTARVEALFQLLQELIRDGEDAPPVDQVCAGSSAIATVAADVTLVLRTGLCL